ncbi:MAG: sugar phosphate isomerase/epimerase [Bacillota bacterium]|jgi:sugar phosphate isomerase/epimerase
MVEVSNSRIAAQLFTLREYTKTPKDIASTLKKVREIGYEVVQLSALGPIDVMELKNILDGEGLKVCITHVGFEALKNDTSRIIDEHLLLGCPNVAIGSMPREYINKDGFYRFAAEASAVGQKLAEAGLTFSYHNHSFELEKFGDRLGLDILIEESDPKYLYFEIDTYWIQHGGGDPAEWINKVNNRIPVVHFKDMGVLNGQQAMFEVGEGNLNWPRIIEACKNAGVEYYAVEQDICYRDPFESLAISLRNLKSMGLE